MTKSTITITFGEVVENHIGNQQIGKKAKNGLSCEKLKEIQAIFDNLGDKTEYYDLTKIDDSESGSESNSESGSGSRSESSLPEAGFLVVRDFLPYQKKMQKVLTNLEWDTKAFMRGQVKNKKARYNLCFADVSQEPNYEEKRGRIYAFDDVPCLDKIRDIVNMVTDTELFAEGNYYYDCRECYIGFHGDTERKIVVGLRIGDPMSIYFSWFLGKDKLHDTVEIELNGGDLYFMSEKATGNDWKKRTIPTLRHAAGYRDVLKKKKAWK